MSLPSSEHFGSTFHWGVSTAAYQIEGAHEEDGKGPSIWDHFTHQKGRIYLNQNGDQACDFYHRYNSDLEILADLGFRNFRFSLSWARILPQGTKMVNAAGIDFYNRVIDRCLLLGIQPWITLYHWDLPLALQKKGGWTNRDILDWFQEYTSICTRSFGDRVRHWMILNEPMVFTGAGHFLGVHAPGMKGLKNFLPAIHHAALCQSLGGRLVRSELSDASIGTTFSCSYIEPASSRERDKQAAIRLDTLLNRLFVEPAVGLGYPVADLPVLKRLEEYMNPADEANLPFDFDFVGIQNYTREIARYSYWVPFVKANLIKAADRDVPVSAMGWEIYPESIYYMLRKFGQYHIKSLIITENGLALNDRLSEGKVQDQSRVDYIRHTLNQVLRARRQGIPVDGYFYWTFIDNFEWAEGFYPRFGLVYNDYKNQKRVIKDSGLWWRRFIRDQISHNENFI